MRERYVTGALSLVLRVTHDLAAVPEGRVAIEVTSSSDDLVHLEVLPGRLCPEPRSQVDLTPRDLGVRLVLEVQLHLDEADQADDSADDAPPVVRAAIPASVRSLSVESGRGPLTADTVECDQLTLFTTTGEVTVRRCSGFVVVTIGRGALQFEEVEGEVNCSVGTGTIDVLSCRGRFRLNAGEGTVTAGGFMGSILSIDNGLGDVSVRETLAETLTVNAKRGQVGLTDFSTAALAVKVGSGGCRCAGDLSDGVHSLTVDRGSLVVEAPSDTPLRFDLTTGAGEIICPLPSVQVGRRGRPSSRGQRLVGVHRGGTVHLNASVGRGDLHLRLSAPRN
ncbi:MAG: DUF4097 family beta strand repeat-containing protein [Anaerolineae bacterium]